MQKPNQTKPIVLSAQQSERKKYSKPTFELIPLKMEQPLLAGSGEQNGILKNMPRNDI